MRGKKAMDRLSTETIIILVIVGLTLLLLLLFLTTDLPQKLVGGIRNLLRFGA